MITVKTLKYWLQETDKLFDDFSKYSIDRDDKTRRRIFIDNKSDILLVAHIDTVLKPKYIRQRKTKSGKVKRIYAQGLDDRLGCAIAHMLSKELKADLLICDLEESMRSTGQYHILKNYNWIAEFDRAGNDVVTYDLDCREFKTALREFWDIGIGSFSDVVQFKTESCCMNVGIGYKFAHSKDSFVSVETMNKQIEAFKLFYAEHKDTEFKQDLDYHDQYIWDDCCDVCGSIDDVDYVHGYKICLDCFEQIFIRM